jgi:hypothetical protein
LGEEAGGAVAERLRLGIERSELAQVLVRLLEMPTDGLVVLDRIADPRRQPVGDARVQLGARALEDAAVGGIANQREDTLRRPDGTGGHPAARQQLVAANILEHGGRILVGHGSKAGCPIAAENITLAGNKGVMVSEGAAFKHTGTTILASYDGDAGTPVRVTREQVGPGAPDPLAESPGIGPEWTESFDHGMADWWAEGGERVWIEDGRLHVRADAPAVAGGGVATVWSRRPLPSDFEIELDAHVIASSTEVNNINLFFCYSDPSGRSLYSTRESRHSAAYNLYHQLNGYIATFVKEAGEARIRLRRNPGFSLLAEQTEGSTPAAR